MIGIVWVRHHGDLSPVLVKGDRLAVLTRAAQVEGWSDDWVDAVEYTADDGAWVVLKGETGEPDLFDAIEEGRKAWQTRIWQDRLARLAVFVPRPKATVWLLPPRVADEAAAKPADWEVLETFVGDGAQEQAMELATQLGLPVFRVRIEAGVTKP